MIFLPTLSTRCSKSILKNVRRSHWRGIKICILICFGVSSCHHGWAAVVSPADDHVLCVLVLTSQALFSYSGSNLRNEEITPSFHSYPVSSSNRELPKMLYHLSLNEHDEMARFWCACLNCHKWPPLWFCCIVLYFSSDFQYFWQFFFYQCCSTLQ